MRLKARASLTALLALAVAAPVVATIDRYTDVPPDHQYAEAIRWVSDPENFVDGAGALFRGFPGNEFRPEQDFTDAHFEKVLDRLLNQWDGPLKRGQAAAFFYYGFQGLRNNIGGAPPPAPVTSHAVSAQQSCVWPLTDPFWKNGDKQAGVFQFGVKPECGSTFRLYLGEHIRDEIGIPSDPNTSEFRWEDSWGIQVSARVEYPGVAKSGERPIRHSAIQVSQSPTTTTKPVNTTTTTTTTTAPTTTTTSSPGCPFPLGNPVWENDRRHAFYWTVDNSYGQGFWLYFRNNNLYVKRGSPVTPNVVWSGPVSTERVRIVFDDRCETSNEVSHSDIDTPVSTTTTTQPTTTTTTLPAWPDNISREADRLSNIIHDTRVLFGKAIVIDHRKAQATRAHNRADEAVELADTLIEAYRNYPASTSGYEARLIDLRDAAVSWQTKTGTLVEWQTAPQPADTVEKKATTTSGSTSNRFQVLPENVKQAILNVYAAWGAAGGFSRDTKRGIYRYVYFHSLWVLEELDRVIPTLGSETDRDLARSYQNTFQNSLHNPQHGGASPFGWLLADAGFISR